MLQTLSTHLESSFISRLEELFPLGYVCNHHLRLVLAPLNFLGELSYLAIVSRRKHDRVSPVNQPKRSLAACVVGSTLRVLPIRNVRATLGNPN